MRYEVWVLDNSIKRIIVGYYKNYKSAKSAASQFTKQNNILRVVIYGTEYVKDLIEDD